MTIPPEAILDFPLCPQDLQMDALSITNKMGAPTLNLTLRILGGYRYIHEHCLKNNFSAGLRKRALPIWGYYNLYRGHCYKNVAPEVQAEKETHNFSLRNLGIKHTSALLAPQQNCFLNFALLILELHIGRFALQNVVTRAMPKTSHSGKIRPTRKPKLRK